MFLYIAHEIHFKGSDFASIQSQVGIHTYIINKYIHNTYTHTYVRIHTYIHTYVVRTYIVLTCIYTYIHTHTYIIHTYMHTRNLMFF